MYICDESTSLYGNYEEELKNLLGGNEEMATSKYGFTKMTPDEFKTWIHKQGNYNYTGIQIHHTAAPAYSNFYKSNGTHEDELVRQNNIKSFHVNTNGWGDIAQHFTIFPNGMIVTGRSLSKTTAIGIKGWNSNKICIEIYGNFDKGKDAMSAEQKNAVVVAYGELCKKFKITPSISTIRCHAWFTAGGTYLGDYVAGKSAKTCPGTNFMGFGNSKAAIQNNFIPLIKNYISGNTSVPGAVAPSAPAINAVGVYKVTADSLNVRKGPGSSYAIVTSVKKGEAYTITKVDGNWGYLKSGAGWIHLGYTQLVSAAASETGVYRVKADSLDICKGPGTSYGRYGSVKKGEAYTITKIQDGWGYLKSGAGWVLMSYMEKVK